MTHYARETSLNEVFDRQNFSIDGSYHATPRLTLTLTDAYIADRHREWWADVRAS